MPAMPTQRYADPETASRYPLEVTAPLAWTVRDDTWEARLPLPDLGPGTLLVPSLALAPPAADEPSPGHYQWALLAEGGCWQLQPVPARDKSPAAPRNSPVTSHIDCFRVHRPVRHAQLRLTLAAEHPPQRYVAGVSCRAFTLARPPLPRRHAALPAPPPARSQTAAPPEIAPRICSPTCISMVLDLWQRPHDWLALAAECHDPVTDMYGIWPLALAAAARRGCLGTVELFDDWHTPLALLERGVPLVTSIRFGPGELPGAPLEETGGHLVVMHSAGPEEIGVCDPAAPAGDVLRNYPAAAFSDAWLRHRGAAYIMSP